MSDILEYAQSIFCENHIDLIQKFFDNVMASRATYKVFLTRRCLNVMYLFCQDYFRSNSEIVESLYSDTGLFSCVPDIADHYIKFRVFPKILIAEDVMNHGLTVNAFIDRYKAAIIRCLKKQDDVDTYAVERDVLNSISIHTMIMPDKPTLLRSQYYYLLRDNIDKDTIKRLEYWFEWLSDFVLLVSEGSFPHLGCGLSLFESDESFHQEYEKAMTKAGFIRSSWAKRYRRDVWVKALSNRDGNIVAFYTVRITQNAVNEKYSVIPQIITSDFTWTSDGQNGQFELLFESCSERCKNIKVLSCVRAETLYSILSYNLLLLLQKDIPKDVLSRINFDVAKSNLTFKSDGLTLPEKLVAYEDPILSWEQMNDFILKSTKQSAPLFLYDHNRDNVTEYRNHMEMSIIEEGENFEQTAFLEYSGREPNRSVIKNFPLWYLFNRIREDHGLNPPRNLSDIADVIGDLLRYADTGVLDIFFDGTNNREANEQFGCFYHVTDLSRFIRPKRCSRYLSVLSRVEYSCGRNLCEMRRRISTLYRDNHELVSELMKFIQVLYDSGQLLSDWDINLLMWVEKDDPEQPLYIKMMKDTDKRMKLLAEYCELYPRQQF